MEQIQSYLEGKWVSGEGPMSELLNPTNEEVLACTSTRGLDFQSALAFARDTGGPALRAMTFAERGAMLKSLSEAIVQARHELLDLSMQNNGATRSDAKFDVDGASFTLAAYAELGEALGDKRYLVDGEAIELLRSRRFAGLHIKTPRTGVALHVNAYNFPAWGLAEKAAVALLAGMPVVSKPATATAYVAYALTKAMVETQALPAGALSLVAGSPGDMLDYLQTGDVLAFTGSSGVGQTLRTLPQVVSGGIPVNVEADSVNAAVLGPDVEAGDPAWDMMIRAVFQDMTQKTGQKCTAIRRVMVPSEGVDEVIDALADSVSRLRIGDPFAEGVRMGPLVSARQRDDVMQGLERLGGSVERVIGQGRPADLNGVDGDRGFFVDAHVFKASDPAAAMAADAVHDHEVFGPAVTILPYDGTSEGAAALVARGQGSLVTSVFSDDRTWTRDAALAIAPWSGRVMLGSAKIAESAPGPGTVLPQLVHGGPGRAGGGEELGGERGMDFYMQRSAMQGYRPLLERLFDGS